MSTFPIYRRESLSLLTDLYQLTMAYSYWKAGIAERQGVFVAFFRENPFRGGYTIMAGLHSVVDWIEGFGFTDQDISFLSELEGNDQNPLFGEEFLDYLRKLKFSCDIDSVPEGTIVFPYEPFIRVVGPIIQCQILETAILNLLNYQSLIATKSARICNVAGDAPVVEFGLRRAQGIDGGVTASRAAYIGGCSATSNVLAGKLFGIPVKGTLGHSWVMCFDSELEAFQIYAEAMPNNCVFLVDTYDSLAGVHRAVAVGHWLRKKGHRMIGIRLDSGDLAHLSIEARRILDVAGFQDAVIVASNNLDENVISQLKEQGASIGVWGVGTHLVTGFDQPALGGVYKLTAVRDDPKENWRYKMKLSEESTKSSIPGVLQARRYQKDSKYIGDVIYDEQMGVTNNAVAIDPIDESRRKLIDADCEGEDLLLPVFRGGRRVMNLPSIQESRDRVSTQLRGFHSSIKRLVMPEDYLVGIAENLHLVRQNLSLQSRDEE